MLNAAEKNEALKICDALVAADTEALEWLAQAASTETFAAGDVVFDAGDDSTGVYVVVSGGLEVRLKEDGKLVGYFEPGALFGEYGMFLQGGRAARVAATETSVLLVIEGSAFRSFLLRCPEVTLQLLQTAVRRLHRAERHRRA